MAFEKFFKAAAEAGIEPFELRSSVNSKLSVGVFQDEIEEYTVADDCTLSGRGNVDGKSGTFGSDKSDDSVIPVMMNAIKESAMFGEPFDEEFYFAGGAEYVKLKQYHPALEERSGEIIDICKRVSETCRKDERVTVCQVKAQYISNTRTLANSKGLNLESKTNYMLIYVQLQLQVGEIVESAFHYALVNDLSEFNEAEFCAKALKDGFDKIGSQPIESGTYDMIYDPEVVASLLGSAADHYSAFDVGQHLSVLEGKIGQSVASEHITIEEKPLTENAHGAAFDDEGVPCQNKILIENGVLKTYVYNLETAKKDGVASTGNGSLRGSNVRPHLGFTVVHNSGKTLDELLSELGNGMYVTEVAGESTGINNATCDYSLQASGFVVENGKITKPVNLVTIAGNIFGDLLKVTATGGESKITLAGIQTPALLVKSVPLSGK